MKIVLSHDIDHLYWNEHYFKDTFLLRYIYRNTKALLKNDIKFALYLKRLKITGRLHRIPELIEFYQKKNLKANFFFGMNNGLRLSYDYKKTIPLINSLIVNGHSVGVHGIAFNDRDSIKIEYNRFKNIIKSENFGIRTHYLRFATNTAKLFKEQGYIFDSSIEKLHNPYFINDLLEIPISIMDASLVPNAQINQNIKVWKEKTLDKLNFAEQNNISYFVINSHDIFFSDNYPTIKQWYIWLIDFLIKEKYKFVSFNQIINLMS